MHILITYLKKCKSVSILKMLKFTFPSNILKSLYHSLIYPYYTYCNLVWGCASNIHLETLVKLQKKAVRIICKAGYYDHTESLFNNLKLLQVKEIYDFNCAKFIYQCYNSNTYLYFKAKLLTNSSFHNYETRNRDLLRKPNVRLQKFMNSFLNNGIVMWNKLHDSIKESPTTLSFKTIVKAFILNNK